MKYLLKLRWHHFILDVIFVTIIFLSFTALFIQIWYLQFEVDNEGLQAKRYLSGPLLEILSDKPDDERDIADWVVMVVMENGIVKYPYEGIVPYLEDLIRPVEGDPLTRFLSQMVKGIPEDMSIVKFTYKGESGLCFYFNDNLPYFLRIMQTPRNLIRMFLAIIIFLFLGAWMTYRLKKNLMELSRAITRMRDLDFDTPLNIAHDNELSDILKAFDEMRKEMKKHRAQGAMLIMSITHDLKTPLTSLRGFLEAIKDGMLDTVEDVMEAVDKMLNKTGLLEERIDEVLEFTRTLQNNKGNCENIFPVDPWLKELKSYFNEESQINEINFSTVEKYSGKFIISGNPKKLTRSVINLYDNACRFVSKDDPIRFSISLEQDNTFLLIKMDDGGNGVAPENREKIFDLFYRKDRGRNTRGMGIGLASVKYVAESHGGSVICRESDLGGASFELRLPVLPYKE